MTIAERQIESCCFCLPQIEPTILKGEVAEKWQVLVEYFEGLVQENIEPNPNNRKGFRGIIPIDDVTFFWGSAEAFTRQYLDKTGNIKHTSWNRSTFGVQRPDNIGDEEFKLIYDKANDYVKTHHEAMWSAIFESCEQQTEHAEPGS